MVRKACRQCKRIVKGNTCAVCRSNDVTTNFQGIVMIFDVESEIAKKMSISAPGTYAVRV